MKIIMIVPDPMVKGGIAAVVNGYRGSVLEERNEITYLESYRDGTKWQKLGKACGAYLKFARTVFRERPDVVHVHSSFGPSFYRKLPFLLWSRVKKIPIVNHIHGAEFDTFYEKASPAKRRLVRSVYRGCTRLIVLSKEWKERIAQIVPEEKIDVIENYCRIPENPGWEEKRPEQLLFLGELGKRKGCYDIPEILERAAQAHPHLLLIMAGDGEMEELRHSFEERGLSDRVCFPGWVRGEEKETLLRESSIFLFPSYHEGMPMAVLEAMSYGLAVITTDVGGIPRLIQDGINGFCRKAGDVEGMSQALCRLLEQESSARELGEKARRLAEENYGLEKHLQRLQEVYERAVQTGKSC